MTDPTAHETGAGADSQRDGGMRALSYIIAGIVVYGGVGWIVDRVFHQSWGVPVGLILGMGFGVYLVITRFAGSSSSGDGQ